MLHAHNEQNKAYMYIYVFASHWYDVINISDMLYDLTPHENSYLNRVVYEKLGMKISK